MDWLTERFNQMTGRITQPVQDAMDGVLEKLESPFTRFFDMIGGFLERWLSPIAAWFEEKFNALGELIAETFLADVKLPSDELLKAIDVPTIETETKAQGYEGGYDAVIKSTLDTYSKGWGRVIEYTGTRTGEAMSYIGSLFGAKSTAAETQKLDAESRRAIAADVSRALHNNIQHEYIKAEILKGAVIPKGETPESMIANNPAAQKAAAEFASNVTGIDILADGTVQPRFNGSEHTGLFALIASGKPYALPTLPKATEALADAHVQFAAQQQTRNAEDRIEAEINQLPEGFRKALTETQLKSLVEARLAPLPQGGETRFSDAEYAAFKNADLSGLIPILSKEGNAFTMPNLDIERSATNSNEWIFTGSDASGNLAATRIVLAQTNSAAAPAVGK